MAVEMIRLNRPVELSNDLGQCCSGPHLLIYIIAEGGFELAFRQTLSIAIAVGLAWAVQPARSETIVCAGSDVDVTYDAGEYAKMVCDALEQTKLLFNRCNIPPLSHPVHIDVVDALQQVYLGLYYCDDDKIEILSPPGIRERRDPNGAFMHLEIKELFRSVVVHELTHAATDDLPCPFEECIVAEEYISYAMQVMSLSLENRRAFEGDFDFDEHVSSDDLSSVLLFMAPKLFSQQVGAHLSQRDAACGYIDQLMHGSILLDRERF